MAEESKLFISWCWFCFFLLGFGGWNVLNSLFLESPLFIRYLPEGSNLSTYLLIAQQIASAIVFLPTSIWTNGAQPWYPHIIIATLLISILSCIVLMIWSLESVNGFSFPFLLIAVITSMIGYISTTYYLPFVSLYKIKYTNAYTLGLGFSLAFTAAISLAQDSGSTNPRFGYKGFFGIILGSQVVSFIAAAWIIFSAAAKTQLVSYKIDDQQEVDLKQEDLCSHQQLVQQGISIAQQELQYNTKYPAAAQGYIRTFSDLKIFLKYWYAPIIQLILAFFAFGIVPSLLPYSAGSYHNGNKMYMYSVSMLYIVDPFARVIYGLNIPELSRLRHLTITTTLCVIFGVILCILAFVQPNHLPFRSHESGGAFSIVLSILTGWFYASSFTGSYALMFNIGTDATEDELYALEKEKKKSGEQVEEDLKTIANTSSLIAEPASPNNSLELQSVAIKTDESKNEVIIPTDTDISTKPCAKEQCPLCIKDNERRDGLRQILYRISGFGLQLGSLIGTFLPASLTIFTATIPLPVEPTL